MGCYSMLLINELGNVASRKVGDCIVSIVGNRETELGFLNERAEAFAHSMEPLFAQ
jgi:hypothetical protein